MDNVSELQLPIFLLAENPTESIDRMTYIYSPVYLSLILIIDEDSHITLLNDDMRSKPRKNFIYGLENFEFVVIQNNVEMTGGHLAPKISEEQFLDDAWIWYHNYLEWEDANLDENENSQLN